MFGWHAPSEFTPFFRRFFSDEETHFISGDSDLGTYRQLKEEVDAVSAVHGRKLLIKNLGLSLKITFLSRLFPGAKFIHVRRNAKDVIHSIDTMRKQLGIPEEDWWSIKPSNYPLLKGLDYPDKLIGQVKSIDLEIQAQVKHLRPENVLEVDFDGFLLNFESEMKTIQTFIGAENRGDNVLKFIPAKPTTNRASLDASFLSAIETAGLA